MPQTIPENYPKLIIDLKERAKTMIHLEESIEENPCGVKLGKNIKQDTTVQNLKEIMITLY